MRLDLALRAVAEAEALEVDDADLRAEAERTAERMEVDPATLRDRLDRSGGWSTLRAERRKMLALRWLMDNATVTDPDGVPIAAEHLAEPEPLSDGAEAGEPGEGGADATAGRTSDSEADHAPDAGGAGIDPASDSSDGAGIVAAAGGDGLDAPAEAPPGDADAPQPDTEAVSSDPGTTRRRRRWIPRP